LAIPPGLVINADLLHELPDNEVVLICTGSQGEPMAALSRIANGDHSISIGSGDTVILASSLIPGNENPVNRVINGLTRRGARVVHKGNALVHVSGHASAGELLHFYNLLAPAHVMPVHGEWRHLRANAALAARTGIPDDRILLAPDGVVVDLAEGRARVVGAVPCGYVYVDGSSVGDITEASLKDRRILGEEGFISVFVAVDLTARTVVVGPEIHARGFAEDSGVFDEVLPQVTRAVEEALAQGSEDAHSLEQVVRRTVGRWVSARHRRRPMIVPVVLET
jgi:ribonuclease J